MVFDIFNGNSHINLYFKDYIMVLKFRLTKDGEEH